MVVADFVSCGHRIHVCAARTGFVPQPLLWSWARRRPLINQSQLCAAGTYVDRSAWQCRHSTASGVDWYARGVATSTSNSVWRELVRTGAARRCTWACARACAACECISWPSCRSTSCQCISPVWAAQGKTSTLSSRGSCRTAAVLSSRSSCTRVLHASSREGRQTTGLSDFGGVSCFFVDLIEEALSTRRPGPHAAVNQDRPNQHAHLWARVRCALCLVASVTGGGRVES